MQFNKRKSKAFIRHVANTLFWVWVCAVSIIAQSSDNTAPTPIISNEVNGRIAARDIGDSRSTTYFYTFNGTSGDLEISVESTNLDGAIDLFTMASLRPLVKVTLISGAGSTNATKTVYLRQAESLILRIQGRTPNDSDGTYHIRFGGSFMPASNNVASVSEIPEPTPTPMRSADKNVRRVNAVGARIEEPASEATASTPEPEPAAEKKSTTPATPRTTSRRTTTNRSRTPRRTTARTEPAKKKSDSETNVEPSNATTPESAPPTSPIEPNEESNRANEKNVPLKSATAKPARTRPSRSTRGATRKTTSSAEKENATPSSETAASQLPQPGARLIIEIKDGTKIERDMSKIRRVTVENGLILIMMKDGKVERQALTNVVRMSIEP